MRNRAMLDAQGAHVAGVEADNAKSHLGLYMELTVCKLG
jgi:hypothetical protein